MITDPNALAATLMELAETNRPCMCSWVSARLREISDNLAEHGDAAGNPAAKKARKRKCPTP